MFASVLRPYIELTVADPADALDTPRLVKATDSMQGLNPGWTKAVAARSHLPAHENVVPSGFYRTERGQGLGLVCGICKFKVSPDHSAAELQQHVDLHLPFNLFQRDGSGFKCELCLKTGHPHCHLSEALLREESEEAYAHVDRTHLIKNHFVLRKAKDGKPIADMVFCTVKGCERPVFSTNTILDNPEILKEHFVKVHNSMASEDEEELGHSFYHHRCRTFAAERLEELKDRMNETGSSFRASPW